MRTTPIVALDTPELESAIELVHRLGTRCRFYKIGSELFTAAGPAAVEQVGAAGADVFLDLKLHDIPNTVRSAARSAAALGVRLLTAHAAGGRPMLEAAREGADGRTEILAVTVLTSLGESDLVESWGRPVTNVGDEVLRLADLAASAGVAGVVCAGAEVRALRARFGDRLAALVPGVRLAGDPSHDQRRVVTPAEARAVGARYIVLGRTVTAAPDPAASMDRVLAEIGGE